MWEVFFDSFQYQMKDRLAAFNCKHDIFFFSPKLFDGIDWVTLAQPTMHLFHLPIRLLMMSNSRLPKAYAMLPRSFVMGVGGFPGYILCSQSSQEMGLTLISA